MKCRMLYRRFVSFSSSLLRRVSHIASYRAISRALRIFGLCLAVVLALTFSPLYSSSVSALDFTTNAYQLALRWGNVQRADLGYGFNTTSNGGLDLLINSGITEGWYTMLSVMFNIPSAIPAGSLITGSIQYCGDDPNGFSGFTSTDTLVLLDQTMMQGMAEWAPGRVCQIFTATWYSRSEINRNTRVILVDSSTGIYLHEGGAIRIPKMGYIALSSGPNYSGSLGDINNKLNGVVSGVGGVQDSVNSAADQAHQDSQAQVDAINEQTQQQQDQYEQEKQEETQREDEMDSQASQAEGIFTFDLTNPFSGLFGLFTNSNCVSIPTLAGLVGSNETTYCSWFSPSVRSILTPAIGIASTMIIFGFIIRWLGGSNTIEVGGL